MSGRVGQTADQSAALERSLEQVLGALRELRIGVLSDEFELQACIEGVLRSSGIPYQKEFRLAPRNRIDFLLNGGIGLEAKRGKPNKTSVLKQLERYAAFDEISAIILVVDRNVHIPISVLGKRCILFGLNRLWGVALP